MLASFLFVLNMDVCKLTGEQMGFPGVIRRRRVTSAKFNDVWQKVLDKMHGGLVPYQALVQVMCGGQLEQACHGCSEELKVSDAILLCKRMRSVEGPALLLGMFSVAVCGKMPCVYSCVQADVEETRNRRDYVRLATKSWAHCALKWIL